jgi:hypothetical protein
MDTIKETLKDCIAIFFKLSLFLLSVFADATLCEIEKMTGNDFPSNQFWIQFGVFNVTIFLQSYFTEI